MVHKCSSCGHETSINLTFEFKTFACGKCKNIGESGHRFKDSFNASKIILNLNQKGHFFGVDYRVTGIVVKKHGNTIFWREYYLRSGSDKIAYLSEFDGHWVFLKPCVEKVTYKDKVAVYLGDTFRWYGDSNCRVVHAEGFFDEIPLKHHLVCEYVLRNQIISSDDYEDCIGQHISKASVQKAFELKKMPSKSGVGIVQPYFFNIKDSAKLLGISLVVFILIHIFVMSARQNKTVYDKFVETIDSSVDQAYSESFSLHGGAAPLKVEAEASVNNSWLNVNIALVNEKTNEVLIANRDIEYYYGYENGESWTEGSKKASFSFCAIQPGRYHLELQTDNGQNLSIPEHSDSSIQLQPNVVAFLRNDDKIHVIDTRRLDTITTVISFNEYSSNHLFQRAKSYFLAENKEDVVNEIIKDELKLSGTPYDLHLSVVWKPNNFRNLVICSLILIGLFLLILFGSYHFEKKKWYESDNSPYSE